MEEIKKETIFFRKFINIQKPGKVAKSQQVLKCIMHGVHSGELKPGDALPSINDLMIALNFTRSSIEIAYNRLKKAGIIESYPGKSYYIAGKKPEQTSNILLLFSNLSIHKKLMFDAFSKTIGDMHNIDFYVYNNDFNLFKKLLIEKMETYSKIVIVPQFTDNEEMAIELINRIPKEKLILMGRLIPELDSGYGAVYETFKDDIYNSLKRIRRKLIKYTTIKIVFPDGSYYSKEIINGFENFCVDFAFDYQLLKNLDDEIISKNAVYIVLSEDDLICLIERTIALELIIGKHIGIISYNENPLKKFILNGITTISAKFEDIGKTTANLVLENSVKTIPISGAITIRNSL